ncbi:MAG: valine--tRNA ligase [Candidatus Ryanbacteria bacterium RIFCSPHIGHO2_02_FULL_45_13b]|uniref:Valine--tRNA ligase n=1 Tax=Candidatus Ryanbacteria bacterium RIFCSPHIGHO2_02_FULL_45_13b TaxID=1802117 RepID=A0A1G2G5G9_9BACT|nr:MAG: valine--tRNA ligase [Candidatus Ryanbacteria bacterium RIFCSPHIGHO2_02_FULL_45_13b]
MSDFSKPYNAKDHEERMYAKWLESGYFTPENLPDADKREPFTIIMPPPNVTGVLHMGHALMLTLQDVMIRYQRMRGKRTLWVPGTDHAAIATQARVEKDLVKEGISRHDLGREEFLRRVEDFAKQSHDTIISQVKTMGASCDWTREAYTLDEKRSLAVRAMFKKMHDDGLIYRGNRIVNWDTKGQTTISDDEIVYEERAAKLYTFRYSKDFPIPIATTRPETKVGDTGVAVHPDDARYKEFVGKEYDLEFCGVSLHIKVVADKEVDPAFGTGAVGVTPAHSHADWEIAKRHDLEIKQVIDEKARMTIGNEPISGQKVADARAIIVEWLRSENLLEKEEDIKQNIATAERTGGVIEPMPKLQWFVAVNKEFTLPHSSIDGIASKSKTTLKEIMRRTVASEQIKIIPNHFEKTYFHWIDNLRDWCISRQIWYGHQIPVWYKQIDQQSSGFTRGFRTKGIEIHVGEAPKGNEWQQDPDTLDTWFSSGMWTFSTLGWPEDIKDLKLYHPTDVLETGYEILFFWVARMILMTGYGLGEIPFRTVYLHGTVRDAKGRKMSKSLGNGIDPIDIAKKFGTDAGRMALIVGNTPGTDMALAEDKIKGYKHFANKIWNASRFVLISIEGVDIIKRPKLTPQDQAHIGELETVAREVTADMDLYRFYLAAEKIYHYFWHTFADKIIEEAKLTLRGGSKEEQMSAIWTIQTILTTSLKLLHPFMPFVTEAVWEHIPQKNKTLLMIEQWPHS